jgi:hypothetical protein
MMEQKGFLDIYEDKTFQSEITPWFKKFYALNAEILKDHGVDFDDFVQEMWCKLFEEKTFSPDRAHCQQAIKNNAQDMIKGMKTRDAIAIFTSMVDDEE